MILNKITHNSVSGKQNLGESSLSGFILYLKNDLNIFLLEYIYIYIYMVANTSQKVSIHMSMPLCMLKNN